MQKLLVSFLHPLLSFCYTYALCEIMLTHFMSHKESRKSPIEKCSSNNSKRNKWIEREIQN